MKLGRQLTRGAAAVLVVAAAAGLWGCGAGAAAGTGDAGAGAGSDPALASLTVSAGALDPPFDPRTTVYSVGPGILEGAVTLTPTAADPGATVMVDGTPMSSGTASDPVPLGMGPTPVLVTVKDDRGNETTYTVVFHRTGPVAQEAYLKAWNTGPVDELGSSMAISGDTLVVGAPGESSASRDIDTDPFDDTAPGAGAVYVFIRDGSIWSQQAYIKAYNADAGDQFGCSVGISGDTLVVGAYHEDTEATGINTDDDNRAEQSGAAYVFVRNGGTWREQAFLKPDNTGAADRFGWSVAIWGDTVLVGAPYEDGSATGVNGASNEDARASGAAYVFVRTAGTWSQQAYLKASNTGDTDVFGLSVALWQDLAVVGAPGEDGSSGIDGSDDDLASDSGAAYVFVRVAGSWSQQAYLKAWQRTSNDGFGSQVAACGQTVVVAAPCEDEGSNASGAAYVFVRDAGTWTQQAYLKASNPTMYATFGNGLALSADSLVVGAPFEGGGASGVNGDQSDQTVPTSGAAYVFVRSAGVWTEASYLKASNTDSGDLFGWSVALAGETVVVGARHEDSAAFGVNGDELNDDAQDSGAVYVFR